MDMLRGHIGSLSLRPALLTHLLYWKPLLSCLPRQSHLWVVKPTHTGSQRLFLSRALGWTPHAIAAAGSAEWHHLLLSQEASTRSGLEQPCIDRKHTNNPPLPALGNELTARGIPALHVPGDVRISVPAVLTLCRCFIHGTLPSLYQMAAWEMEVQLQTFPYSKL